MRSLTFAFAVLAVAAGAVHCSSADDSTASGSADQTEAINTPKRDWVAHPAIVEIDEANEVYAVSDAHGGYEALVRLLAANHLVNGFDPDPAKVKWTGKDAILVIAGDLIDKGTQSIEVIDLVRSLEKQTRGRVLATMGNHEAEFLANPSNDKATSTGKDKTGIDQELDALGIDPESLVKGRDKAGRGLWLSSLPLGVRVKKWFFSHGGNTDEQSIPELEKTLEHAIDKNGYGDKAITGGNSILEAQKWYGDPDKDKAGEKTADALGVKHMVFGHDPGAFGEKDKLKASSNGILFKIDCAMGLSASSSAASNGYLLHITTKGTDTAESLDDHGKAESML